VNAPVTLDPQQRLVVHRTMMTVCEARRWPSHAINVRTNHVHIVVSGPGAPEPMMNALKSWSTRRLREDRLVPRDHRIWSRHGSTRYLWNRHAVDAACAYVRDQSHHDDAGGATPR
jgi:REP element-mobilizing transposase RayT